MNTVARPAADPVAWLVYPAVMVGAVVLFLAFLRSGWAVPMSTYVAVAAAALTVAVLERLRPHLTEWQGRRADMQVDAIYMLTVQMLLPVVLAVTLSATAVEQLRAWGLEPSRLWPHHWAIGWQVLLMLVVVDFMRYWLHVAAHRYSPLWRLHAVHHSPDRLYWLNVGRFHPVEKVLQYVLDALPFVVLLVDPVVVALYYVLFATNGFFQHCNVKLRFGWLSYVFSTPELHRWHHSRVPGESNGNYSNTIILWDLVFGTRFLPRDREIRDLGVPNRQYPMGLQAQLKAPFIRGLADRDSAILSWTEIALNLAILLRMTRLRATAWRRLLRAADDPRQTQDAVLAEILASNAGTNFGREHSFAGIRNHADFADRVPVQTYETLRPYLEREIGGGSAQLTIEQPLLYVRTSGTTGASKYLPMTPTSLAYFREAQAITACVQYFAVPEAYTGRSLGIVSAPVEGYLDNGIPYGSASGHLYRHLPGPARAKYVIPWQVFEIADYELRYRLIARLALVEKNLTHWASANPSTFLRLQSVIHTYRASLLADLESGGFSGDLMPEVRRAVEPLFPCSAQRLAELRQFLAAPKPEFRELWPWLRLVTTWTGGSVGVALDALRTSLPPDTRIADPGYLASEFRGSITVDLERNLAVPALRENFYEFVTRESWDEGAPEFLTLDRLEGDRVYYIVVTTRTGLYRYFINDLVQVTGIWRRTPTLRFLQKGQGTTSITGEKLHESQVIEAVRQLGPALGVTAGFFVVLADVPRAAYRLLLEPTAACGATADEITLAVEAHLAAVNIEYKDKRASGRLKPLTLSLMAAGFGEAYKQHCLARGQREAQFKVLLLRYETEFGFDFRPWLVGGDA